MTPPDVSQAAHSRGDSWRPEPRHLILALGLAFAVAGYVYLTQSLRSASPDHGDYWTDMALITAAHNLDMYGFKKLRLGVTTDNGPQVGLPPIYFLHHPSFPTVVLGAFYRLRFSTETARLFPLLVSCSALVAMSMLVGEALADWRAGVLALLAMAASAPFRLLSDAFGYQSYDMAAKLWTFLFVTLGARETVRRRRLWLAISGGSALLTITLSGFEMVPAIALYSITCPLIIGAGDRKDRFRSALLTATWVASGFAAGMLLRLAHNVWLLGGPSAVIEDFLAAFRYRALFDHGGMMWGRSLPLELLHRALAYYPIHLLVIAVGVVTVAALHRQLPDSSLRAWSLWWLLAVLLGDLAWYVVFREHSHRHVHTIYHLLPFVSAATGLASLLLWEAAGRGPRTRPLALFAGVVALLLAISDVGLRPYGNVQRSMDWTWRRQQTEDLASALPATAVVVIDTADMDPSPQFFLGRTFLLQRQAEAPSGSPERWFLLTLARPDHPAYTAALSTKRLVRQTQEFALFDLVSRPDSQGSAAAIPGARVVGARD